jgi:hypothetical protein
MAAIAAAMSAIEFCPILPNPAQSLANGFVDGWS